MISVHIGLLNDIEYKWQLTMTCDDTSEFSLRALQVFDYESDKCRFLIEASHDFIIGFNCSVESLNKLDEREEFIKKLIIISDELNACQVVSSSERPLAYSICLFSSYKTNISTLLHILNVDKRKITGSYANLIKRCQGDIRRSPIKNILAMDYAYKDPGRFRT